MWFKNSGAEILLGDTNDVAFLTKAFRGADADPAAPDYRAEQDGQGEAIVEAIRNSDVKYVVALSSLGGDLSQGTGVIVGLHGQEERLKRLKDTNVVLLRPVSFFENFYNSLGLISEAGINGDSVAAHHPVPMIATRDIADVAAKVLKARDWNGVVVRELLGQRDLSYAEATRIIGERIGKPDLQYVQFSYEDEANALVAGMSESFANLYVEMTRAFNEEIKPPRRNQQNTTPTRFEDFADELAHAYTAM